MGTSNSHQQHYRSSANNSARPRANSEPSAPKMIPDLYKSLPEVEAALRKAGLEGSNLILGIDFTKSNTWTGKSTFGGFCLHHISSTPNPYQQVISIVGQTLSSFDDDKLIPCYGFGDTMTTDRSVFSFVPRDKSIFGFENVLATYTQLVPHVQLAGPTSFAPIIYKAIDIVAEQKSYHILVIIADGQVTRSVDTPQNALSSAERETIDAIVAASKYPLSIIMIGVGDGPWDQMKWFDDRIPQRQFDNFQFVAFHQIMSGLQGRSAAEKEATFATHALMEIPEQFREIQKLRLLDSNNIRRPTRRAVVLDPPVIPQQTPAPYQQPPSYQQPPAYQQPPNDPRSSLSSFSSQPYQQPNPSPLYMSYQPQAPRPQGDAPPVMSYDARASFSGPVSYGQPQPSVYPQYASQPPVNPYASSQGAPGPQASNPFPSQVPPGAQPPYASSPPPGSQPQYGSQMPPGSQPQYGSQIPPGSQPPYNPYASQQSQPQYAPYGSQAPYPYPPQQTNYPPR